MSGAIHFYTMRDKSSQHNGTFDIAAAQGPIYCATPVTVIDPKLTVALIPTSSWSSANSTIQ